MASENLWGALPDPQEVVPPVSIMREQTPYLGKSTNNMLIADVGTSRGDKYFMAFMRIIAPTLEHYQIDIAETRYPLTSYPARLSNSLSGRVYDCKTEKDFREGLREILGSVDVKKVIAGLLNQVYSQQ